jgi:hypothetical protein
MTNIRGKKYLYVGQTYSHLIGLELMSLSAHWSNSMKMICPNDSFYWIPDTDLKEIIVEAPVAKNRIEDLIKLKAEFTTDEILRLNGEGLL